MISYAIVKIGMEQNHKNIFPIIEIDKLIFDLLDKLNDYSKLFLVNHYYHELCLGFLLNFKKFLFEQKYHNFYIACTGNHLEIAKYFYQNKILVYVHHKNPIFIKKPGSSLHTWLKESRKFVPDTMGTINITDTVYCDINIHLDNESIFRHACENGYLGMVKWLYKLDLINKIDISKCDYYAFVFSCQNNHLQIVKYLLKVEKMNIEQNIKYLLEKRMILHCQGYTLYLSRLIVSICEKKNLDMIKLFLLEYRNINIHLENESPFRMSCMRGCLEIAKFLYQYGLDSGNPINIRILNDEAFKQSCENGHIEVAKWLENLCNEYFCEINDKRIIAYVKCGDFHLIKL